MPFFIDMALRARAELEAIEQNPAHVKRLKAVCKALAFSENCPSHPGLNTHKYSFITAEKGEDVFEVYAENKTQGAYRLFSQNQKREPSPIPRPLFQKNLRG